MKIIAFVDDNNGLAFNKRRQSRDSFALKHICDNYNPLRIAPYSWSLFEKMLDFGDCNVSCYTDKSIFDNADETNDYVFIEKDIDFVNHKEHVDEIVILKWNRKYPFDIKFPIISDINPNLKLINSYDFKGKSHDLITVEVYKLEEIK